jgi:Fe-S-cluster-containing hydrogenase component 2
LAGLHNCLEAVKESHVFVDDKDVHEPAKITVVVEHSRSETRVECFHRQNRVFYVLCLNLHFAGAPDEDTKLTG